jgi:alpha-L-rhamnosidase
LRSDRRDAAQTAYRITAEVLGRIVWDTGRDPATLPPVDPPTDEERSFPDPAAAPLYLRRGFELAEPPVRARLYATAHGVYEPSLNGEKVGDHELAPGWTEYHHRLQYQTYDVTGHVRAGVNVLGAIVADGWWSGHVGFDPSRPAQLTSGRFTFTATSY